MRVVIKPLGLIVVGLLFAFLAIFAAKGCFGPRTGPVTGSGDLPILADTAKRTWMFDQVALFNYAQRRPDGQQLVSATWKDQDTREALHAILNGKDRPVVWVPSGNYWVGALNDSWRRAHPGTGDLVNTTDSASYRTYLRTPLVFLTTADKATALRPLLNGTNYPSWRALHDLCAGKTRVPWGAFRAAVADPLRASSGFMLLGLVLEDYVQHTGGGLSLDRAPHDLAFVHYLREMHRGLVDNAVGDTGEKGLSRSYAADPSRFDLIVTYESDALEAVSHNGKLAVIYPDPTAVADQTAMVLNGDWVKPEQRAAARSFLDFLSRDDAQKDGIHKHYRPIAQTPQITLLPELDRYHSFGFQQVFNSAELPPYATVNEVAYAWSGSPTPTQTAVAAER